MLRRLRHKLRMIDYYAAPRPRTPWTRAVDLTLPIALLLALVAAPVAEIVASRPAAVAALTGRLARQADGSIIAHSASATGAPLPEDPLGLFVLHLDEVRHGWPLASSLTHPPPRLDLDLFERTGPRVNAVLPTDSPVPAALAAMLRAHDDQRFHRRWTRSDGDGRALRWPMLIANVVIWWTALALILYLVIQLLRAAAAVIGHTARARRRDRRLEGHCGTCGYDLRGLEFSERCPECGTLA